MKKEEIAQAQSLREAMSSSASSSSGVATPGSYSNRSSSPVHSPSAAVDGNTMNVAQMQIGATGQSQEYGGMPSPLTSLFLPSPGPIGQ